MYYIFFETLDGAFWQGSSEDWPLRWTFRPWILTLSGAGPHPVIRRMSLSACSSFISTYSRNIPSTINGLSTRYKLRQTILRLRNNTRNSIVALPIYRWRYSCSGVSSLTPLSCPRCCGMSRDPLCDCHSKLHLDFEVLLPVLRRPNPVRRRLCGLRQFFDEMLSACWKGLSLWERHTWTCLQVL